MQVAKLVDSCSFDFIKEYARNPKAIRQRLSEYFGGDVKGGLMAILNGGGLTDAQKEVPDLVQLYKEIKGNTQTLVPETLEYIRSCISLSTMQV